MKSIMIDLETLGADSHAAVISIGLAAFDESGVTDTLGLVIDPKYHHGEINPETIAWWVGQSSSAIEYSFKNPHCLADTDAAAHLLAFVMKHGCDELWAKGPDFDCVILRHWWDRVSMKSKLGPFPISFRHWRDVRTIFAEAERLHIDIKPAFISGTAHNPVDDAAMQARAVCIVRKHLGAFYQQ